MIFVTVGTQLPFDRMIHIIDEWAIKNSIQNVFAQIGNSQIQPKGMKYKTFLTPQETDKCIENADYIISHAGMGTILSAVQHYKPLIIFPRHAKWGEQRNNHQLSTAKLFKDRYFLEVADNSIDFEKAIKKINEIDRNISFKNSNRDQLINYLSKYISIS